MIPLTTKSLTKTTISGSTSPLSPCQQSTPIQPQLNFSKQQQQQPSATPASSKSQLNTSKSGNFANFKASEMTVIKSGGKVTKSQRLNSYEVNKKNISLKFIITLYRFLFIVEHAFEPPIRS